MRKVWADERASRQDGFDEDEEFVQCHPREVVAFLNDLHSKAAPSLRSQLNKFVELPPSGARNAIILLAYGLESSDRKAQFLLAEVVNHVGPLAVAEIDRLMAIGDDTILLNSLRVLCHVNAALPAKTIDRARSATKHTSPDVRRAAMKFLEEIDEDI